MPLLASKRYSNNICIYIYIWNQYEVYFYLLSVTFSEKYYTYATRFMLKMELGVRLVLRLKRRCGQQPHKLFCCWTGLHFYKCDDKNLLSFCRLNLWSGNEMRISVYFNGPSFSASVRNFYWAQLRTCDDYSYSYYYYYYYLLHGAESFLRS